MRRLVSTLASFSLVAGSMVIAAAVGSPASAAATPTVPVASGDSALPDVPTLLTADANGLVYETLNAADQPTLWAEKLNNGAASGDPVQLTGGNFTRLTANGFQPGRNLSIAGSVIGAAGDTFTSFGSEQQRVSLYDLSTDTATNPIISGFGDGGGLNNSVYFAGAAPDGMLFLDLIAGSPASVHVMDEDQARDAPVDLGTLPDASTDPTLLADVTAATSPDGSVIAYPTTTDGQEDLAFIPYNGDGPSVLATDSQGTFDSSLIAGGGLVAWANYLQGFGAPGCNYFTLPLDGSGNETPTHYAPQNFCEQLEGVTDSQLVFGSFTIFGGEDAGQGPCPLTMQTCAYQPFATLDLLSGDVTQSSTVNALSAATDGTSLYLSKGTALGSAGIYSATSATSAETQLVAAPAKPLTADQVALSPGQVTWSDDSATTYPVSSRSVSNNGTSLDLGTPATIASTTLALSPYSGYGASTSGKRTAYAAPPTGTGTKDRLLVTMPDGSTQTVTTYADGSPFLNGSSPEPATVQVSGSNVLYLTNDPTEGYDAHLYSTITHQTRNFPAAAAYALSGGYLAWVGMDGSVSRQDIVANTPAVQLRPATALTSGQTLSVNAEVAAAGDYVSWLVRECITTSNDFSCAGNTEAAYRNAATMDPAIAVLSAPTTPAQGATPTTPQNIAMSADYLLVDELNPAFNPNARVLVAVKLADGTSANVTANNDFVGGAGKFAADGSTVAWIDPTGAPQAEGLDSTLDQPRVLTVDAPSRLTTGDAADFEVAASAPLAACTVTITQGATTVRTLDCSAADGDGVVAWDGTDGGGNAVAAGSYTWTITGSNSGGDLLDYTGASNPITGTLNVVGATTTSATWPTSITYGRSFTVHATVNGTGGTPTGTVTLKSGSTTLATQVLSGGTATLAVGGTKLTPGSHTLTLGYGGSTTDAASSTSKTFTVHKAPTKIAASWPPPTWPRYGGTWSVRVTVSATGTTPTGTVTLKNGSTTLATHTLSGGKATLSVGGRHLLPGWHTLTLSYGGSSKTATSTLRHRLWMNKAHAYVSEWLSSSQVKVSQHARLRVRVTATGGVRPVGWIRVYNGTHRIARVWLHSAQDGRLWITLPKLARGKHRIHAVYGGSSVIYSGSGKSLTLTVIR